MDAQAADHILIPLLDGNHSVAQIARIEDDRILLFTTRTRATPQSKTKPFSEPQVIAAFCLEHADVPTDLWPVIGYEPIPRITPFANWTLAQQDTHDATIVEAFVNAVHGLYPWDGFPDPDFFTNLLRSPDALPFKARMTADFPRPDDAP